MSAITIGIIDYGMGNHASVAQCLRAIGYRVRISREPEQLDRVDAIVMPGVGAFPAAIKVLHEIGLVYYLQEQARRQRPLIGICLGMQLLAGASHEYVYTAGLGLIPGEVVPFAVRGGHIGWNTLECRQQDPLFSRSDGQAFYFNHSFYYTGPPEYQVAVSRHPGEFAAIIRRGTVVGLQFHPEKSQAAGRELLQNLITGLLHA